MAGIRGKDTKPERLLRSAMHAQGMRYRLHVSKLPGRPDIVLPRYRTVILVHGCFWHRHSGCRFATIPATRQEFWNEKFASTVARDKRNAEALSLAGWRVAIVWECAIKAVGASAIAGSMVDWIRLAECDPRVRTWSSKSN